MWATGSACQPRVASERRDVVRHGAARASGGSSATPTDPARGAREAQDHDRAHRDGLGRDRDRRRDVRLLPAEASPTTATSGTSSRTSRGSGSSCCSRRRRSTSLHVRAAVDGRAARAALPAGADDDPGLDRALDGRAGRRRGRHRGSYGILRVWGFDAAADRARGHAGRPLEPAREPRLSDRRRLRARGHRRADRVPRDGGVRRRGDLRRRRRGARARALQRPARERHRRRRGAGRELGRWASSAASRWLERRELRALPPATRSTCSSAAGTCSRSPRFAGSLTVFLVLLLSLRALRRPGRRGLGRAGVRRVVAGAPARQHPDHAGRDRRRRARA